MKNRKFSIKLRIKLEWEKAQPKDLSKLKTTYMAIEEVNGIAK